MMEDFNEMDENQLFPSLDDTESDLLAMPEEMEEVAPDTLLDLGGMSIGSPFDSGFDEDHPMPTYEELLNAGFSDEVAVNILYGGSHCYSQRELYHCFYESDDPLKAYNEMVEAKADECIKRADRLIHDIEDEFGF